MSMVYILQPFGRIKALLIAIRIFKKTERQGPSAIHKQIPAVQTIDIS